MIRLILLLLPLTAAAEWPIRSAFLSIPEQLVGFLATDGRMDLLDYYEAGMKERGASTFYGETATIAALDSLQVVLNVGLSQRYAIAMLPSGPDTVYAVITTLLTPTADSKLTLYDSRWQPLKSQFAEPKPREWTSNGKAPDQLPFLLSEYTLKGTELTITDRTAQWDYRDEAKSLRPHLIYIWDGRKKKFVKQK